MDALWTARKAIQIGILVGTHPFSVDHCILCDQQLLSTSIAHLVVECEQVTGHRIQSGLVPAIQKSRLRLLGRALDPGVENVYTWLRGGVLNGEADLDQRWLDGIVEHESMGTRHDNRALAARLADFLQNHRVQVTSMSCHRTDAEITPQRNKPRTAHIVQDPQHQYYTAIGMRLAIAPTTLLFAMMAAQATVLPATSSTDVNIFKRAPTNGAPLTQHEKKQLDKLCEELNSERLRLLNLAMKLRELEEEFERLQEERQPQANEYRELKKALYENNFKYIRDKYLSKQ
ncbi:hypothetical protein BASA83_004958 [Batrachochytrium salamandrivorans]|nr:hypothetical protein BASA83_004958 [Batrachochytrium salamandrivorans]